MKTRILVIDDEKNIRRSIQMTLEGAIPDCEVQVCESALRALEMLSSATYQLALVDIRLGEIDGLQLFQRMVTDGITTPVIFISGNASLSEAAQAVKLGAFDFIEKPFSSDRLTLTVQRCLEHYSLKDQLTRLESSQSEFLGSTQITQDLLRQARRVARSNATVLIRGESGTGKELVAKLIHRESERRARPFVKVNCSAIPETLIESELFGYEKGAFTGAQTAKRGFFELANHGTLFLDEIGDMSLNAQAKVLRAIQNAEIQKLGSERLIPIQVRLIAATHKDLAKEVEAGRFREDLYYRVHVVPLQIPPLRERAGDIPLLIQSFVHRFCEENGFGLKEVSAEAMETLRAYPWPGNVRELQNLMERLVILSDTSIQLSDLPENIRLVDPSRRILLPLEQLTLKDFKEKTERDFLVASLRKFRGNVSKASEALEIERTHLHKKIHQYGIEKREYF